MISSILLFLYQVAMTIAVLPIALYLSFITPDNHFNAFRERMGFASPSVQRASPATQDERGGGEKQNQITVWFHAASVGEVNLLGPLVKELRKQKEKTAYHCDHQHRNRTRSCTQKHQPRYHQLPNHRLVRGTHPMVYASQTDQHRHCRGGILAVPFNVCPMVRCAVSSGERAHS